MECMFEGQVGGVTHLLFSPDGTKLYSGGRKVRCMVVEPYVNFVFIYTEINNKNIDLNSYKICIFALIILLLFKFTFFCSNQC